MKKLLNSIKNLIWYPPVVPTKVTAAERLKDERLQKNLIAERERIRRQKEILRQRTEHAQRTRETETVYLDRTVQVPVYVPVPYEMTIVRPSPDVEQVPIPPIESGRGGDFGGGGATGSWEPTPCPVPERPTPPQGRMIAEDYRSDDDECRRSRYVPPSPAPEPEYSSPPSWSSSPPSDPPSYDSSSSSSSDSYSSTD